ncbi:hypothetical protein Dimus_016866 [Dionaea muscipula]
MARTLSTPPAKSHVAAPGFDFKGAVKSSWKLSREAPRLSLDSRFAVDAKGSLHPREISTSAANLSGDESEKQRPSPSVVARLMGLDALPSGDGGGSGAEDPERKVQLLRSASESRSRDLFHYPFIDSNTFLSDSTRRELNNVDQLEYTHSLGAVKPEKLREPRPPLQQWKRYYDTTDFFPEAKRMASPIHGEIERRLKMRDTEESSKQLETLNQILEAIQLKGLLHSKLTDEKNCRRNFVYDRKFIVDESPIVVMKPAKRSANESPPPKGIIRRNANNVSLARETSQRSPRRERPKENRNENRSTSPVTAARRKPPAITADTRRRDRGREWDGESAEQRRGSPGQSPRLGSRRSDQPTCRPTSCRRPTVDFCRSDSEKSTFRAEEESSIIPETSYTARSRATDTTKRWKVEEYREGRSLLERCDNLLHSIAEMTATTTNTAGDTTTTTASCSGRSNATELQPSPVSVLHSSFHKEEDEESPSPVTKRTIDFKEEAEQVVELDDHEMSWSPSSSVVQANNESDTSSSSDLAAYISEVLRASDYLLDTDHLFLSLEKQQLLKGKDTSKSSRIHRRLIFDKITEIIDRNQQLPPWTSSTDSSPAGNSVSRKPSLNQICTELQGIKDPSRSDDPFDAICGVLKRDLAKEDSTSGWGDCAVEETPGTVLDIERMIFKDLIGEAIHDLATTSGTLLPLVGG